MADSSGGAGKAASLPTGGGAVSGIGEKFSPDPHTGTGNFGVPVEVPPGRDGFAPDLSLSYSTGAGNGPFGLGWSVDVPTVGRKTSDGLPVYAPDEDTFVRSGEDLVAVDRSRSGATRVTRYRPRTETSFDRVERHVGGGTDHWEVQRPDGSVELYGTVDAAGADPAAVADPDDRGNVYEWRLSERRDASGNRIEYDYRRDAGSDGDHRWDRLYLDRVRYVEAGDGDPEYLVTVEFEYEPRPDALSRYRSGFEVRTRERCTRIAVRTHAGETRLVRTYDLVYRDELDDAPANGVSQLARVEVTGHDGEDTQAMPPLTFEYTDFDPEAREFEALSGPLARRSLSEPDLAFADLSGDALPDLVELGESVRYWRNLGDGEFATARSMDDAPSGLRLSDPGVSLVDADGDGRIDLLNAGGSPAGYFPLDREGGWSESSFRAYGATPSVDLSDPGTARIDLDGDGATDAVRSSEGFECFFNDPGEGWTDARRVPTEEVPPVDFDDPRVRTADLSGDGLQDVVVVRGGVVEYWPNLGYGDFGPRVAMPLDDGLPDDHDPGRVLLGDVDGDGLTDLVYVGDDAVRLWINRGGRGFRDPVEVRGTPPVADADGVELVDLYGRGIPGLLWTAAGGDRKEAYFLDFVGGTKPYLLAGTDNGMGSRTGVEYDSSTDHYLSDREAGLEWKTSLPSSTWVVSKVESTDRVAGATLTREYDYHHGYWDGAEREFRGFGLVDRRDTETFGTHEAERGDPGADAGRLDREQFSPPSLTRTWYHQGPVGPGRGDWRELDYGDEYYRRDPDRIDRPAATADLLATLPRRDARDAVRALRGNVLRREVYALDGSPREDRPHEVTEKRYGVREESPPTGDRPRDRVFFPHEVATRTTRWERGDDPMTQFTYTGGYDRYGQPGSVTEVACPRGWRPGDTRDDYLATHRETTWAHRDDDRYLVDRTATETTYSVTPTVERTVEGLVEAIRSGTADGEVVDHARHYYDGDPFEGLDLGTVGDHGALVRTERLVATDDLLAEAFEGPDPVDDAGRPPCLSTDGSSWPADYPSGFASALSPARDVTRSDGSVGVGAGYLYRDGGDGPDVPGYYAVATQRRYDFQTDGAPDRGLVVAERDPLGNERETTYDDYDLFPVEIEGPTGTVRSVEHDYRVCKPRTVTDENGNRRRNAYTPLGMVASVARLGSPGEPEGDTPARPTELYEYDLRAFERSSGETPPYVHVTERVEHRGEADGQGGSPSGADGGESPPGDGGGRNGPAADPDPDGAEVGELLEAEMAAHPGRFVQSRAYSDGSGRVVQSRSEADPAAFGGDAAFGNGTVPASQDVAAGSVDRSEDPDRVRVTGWKTYDNKGNVVREFEPFFDSGWEYLPRSRAVDRAERTVDTHYDALGRKVRTVGADGSESRVVHGVPRSLDDPENFDPTPWEVYEYDENDNAERTHGSAAADYDHHWNAPTSRTVDARGREVETVERNRTAGEAGTSPRLHRTEREFDARDNVTRVVDPLGREAFRYVYDLTGSRIRSESLDAGTERTVHDAAGNPVEVRDARGAVALRAFDEAGRRTREWGRDDGGSAFALVELTVYGDGDAGPPERRAKAANLLGRVHRRYDGAGSVTFEYDFKGNPVRETRRVATDDALRDDRVDWSTDGRTLADRERNLLADRRFAVERSFDALDRVDAVRYPRDVEARRDYPDDRRGGARLRREYTPDGAVSGVDLDRDVGTPGESTTTFVADAAYTATGERTLVAYGNGVMTRYARDADTRRLARQLTQRYRETADGYEPATGATVDPLYDRAYDYDLVGNVREVRDRTPGCGVAETGRPDELDRTFEYDALDRLTEATGREAETAPAPRPWSDARGGDPDAYGLPDVDRTNAPRHTASYTERYDYDAAGNLTELRHAGRRSWTRSFGMGGRDPEDWPPGRTATGSDAAGSAGTSSNRLTHVHDGPATGQTHDYDAAGNLRSERNSRYRWDHAGRLASYAELANDGTPSVEATYAYDAGGQRVKKVVDKGTRTEVTVYVAGLFEYRRVSTPTGTRESETLHVTGGEGRIATVRVGDPIDPDDARPPVRYHVDDHLGSSVLVVDGDGDWVNYEEYTPFGETSFGGHAKKRYRYTGKERDEESGLYYSGARYYAPWLCRWTAPDPAGPVDGPNLYAYVTDNPVRGVDPTGMGGTESDESQSNSGTNTSGGGSGDGTGSGGGEQTIVVHVHSSPNDSLGDEAKKTMKEKVEGAMGRLDAKMDDVTVKVKMGGKERGAKHLHVYTKKAKSAETFAKKSKKVFRKHHPNADLSKVKPSIKKHMSGPGSGGGETLKAGEPGAVSTVRVTPGTYEESKSVDLSNSEDAVDTQKRAGREVALDVVHELGHQLGLGHEGNSDVMGTDTDTRHGRAPLGEKGNRHYFESDSLNDMASNVRKRIQEAKQSGGGGGGGSNGKTGTDGSNADTGSGDAKSGSKSGPKLNLDDNAKGLGF